MRTHLQLVYGRNTSFRSETDVNRLGAARPRENRPRIGTSNLSPERAKEIQEKTSEILPQLQLANQRIHWLPFQRARRSGNGRKPGEHGYGFLIIFLVVVAGPISVGYGAHFGLGLFTRVLSA